MIELIGGPHDGRRPYRNPKDHEVLVGEGGVIRKQRHLGENERYFEEGVCAGCGVRSQPEGDVRRFIHVSMREESICELCGKETLTTVKEEA